MRYNLSTTVWHVLSFRAAETSADFGRPSFGRLLTEDLSGTRFILWRKRNRTAEFAEADLTHFNHRDLCSCIGNSAKSVKDGRIRKGAIGDQCVSRHFESLSEHYCDHGVILADPEMVSGNVRRSA